MNIILLNGLKDSYKHQALQRIRENYTCTRTQMSSWSYTTDNTICFIHTKCQPYDSNDTLYSKHLIVLDEFLTFMTNATYSKVILCGANWEIDLVYDKTIASSEQTIPTQWQTIKSNNTITNVIFQRSRVNFITKRTEQYKTWAGSENAEPLMSELAVDKYDWFWDNINITGATIIDEDSLTEDEIYTRTNNIVTS